MASHLLGIKLGTKCTVDDHLPEAYLAWKMRSPQWCIIQAQQVGSHWMRANRYEWQQIGRRFACDWFGLNVTNPKEAPR